MADDVRAQIAVQKLARPDQILRDQTLIEPQLLAQFGHIRIRRAKAQHGAHRVARHQTDDQEHNDAHDDQGRDGQCQTSQDEADHVAPSSARSTRARIRFSDSVKCTAAIAAAASARPSSTAATRS